MNAFAEVAMINAGSEFAPLPAIEVMVNGKGPFRFGIETGARFLVVSDSIAKQIGLTLKNFTGGINEYRADSIAIGSAVLGEVTLVALPRTPRGVDGLLGLPAFNDLLLTIDYPAAKVRLSRDTLPNANGRDVLQMRRVSDIWAVQAAFGTQPQQTIIDTRPSAAFGIEPEFSVKLAFKGEPVVTGRAGGAGIPTTNVKTGILDGTLTVGTHQFVAPPLTIHALPADYPTNRASVPARYGILCSASTNEQLARGSVGATRRQ
ncbi:MAG: retropepsin-like aspartic protease [Gemmatimonadaceae bacterium]